ncbi:MAG: sodium:solute symporter family protein [Oscillospiraceae bacterium]
MVSVQLVVIILYFALTIGIGLWSLRKSKTSDSFHGAALGVFAIVCASAGEWLGGTATTGVSEYGFTYGLSGAWYTIANGIGVMFLALLFAKLYRSLSSVTVPGIIERFFGVHARTVSSILLTIVMLAVGLSQMIAAGKLGQSLMGFDFTYTVIVFAIIFIVYTLAGGMNAVASTNKMHLFVMYGGAILAVIVALTKVDGWSGFRSGIASVEAIDGGNYFNMFSIGWSKVSSWLIASLLGACTAQAGIQPVLAAKDVPTAKKACIITAFVAAPFGLFTALLGMIAKVMSHNGTLLDTAGKVVTDGKLALPTLMMNLPPLVGGLILASILAAILSTVSPIILSSGTMITKDIYQRVFKPDASDAEVLRVSRIATALSGVICSIGAITLVNSSKVLDIVYSAYSLRGAIFIVVLLGIYWKRASQKGACWSLVCTGVIAVFWVVWKMYFGSYPIIIGGFELTETYAAVVVAFVATVLFSYIFPPTEAEKALKASTKALIAEK